MCAKIRRERPRCEAAIGEGVVAREGVIVVRTGPGNASHHHLLLALLLLGKDLAAHLKNTLKALTALESVLLELVHETVLDAVLNSLPATTESGNVCRLLELGLVVTEGSVNDLLLDVDEVVVRQVLADHGDGLVFRVDIAGLIDVLVLKVRAHNGLDPVRARLLAGDEALSAQDTSLGVDLAGDGVDGDDVLRLVVPRAVLSPVGGRDLVPRVVEGDGVGEDLHDGGRRGFVGFVG